MNTSIYRVFAAVAALVLVGSGNIWASEVKPIIVNPETNEQKSDEKNLVGLKLQVVPTAGAKPFTEDISFDVYRKKGDEKQLDVETDSLGNGAVHIKNLKPGKYYIKARHTEAWPWPGIETGTVVEVKKGKLAYYIFNMNLGKVSVHNKVTDSTDASPAKVVTVTMYSSNGKKIGDFHSVNKDIWVRPGKYKITAEFGHKDKKNTGVFEVKANDSISKTFTFTMAGLRISASGGKDSKRLDYMMYRIFSVVNNKKDHLIWGCAEDHSGNRLNCWDQSKSLSESTLVVPPGKYILTAQHENGGFMKTTVEVKKNETKTHVFNFSLGTLNSTLPTDTSGRIYSKTDKKFEYVSVTDGTRKALLTPGHYRIEVKRNNGEKIQKTMDFTINKNESTSIKIVLNR